MQLSEKPHWKVLFSLESFVFALIIANSPQKLTPICWRVLIIIWHNWTS